MTNEDEPWKAVETVDDEPSAQALAGLLRNEGVPVEVKVDSPVPGLIGDVQILVPNSLAHRARWIIKTNEVSEAELNFAATGQLGAKDQP